MVTRPDAVDAERSTFRDELLDAGLLVATGPAGCYARSAVFEGIVAGISRMISEVGAADGPVTTLTMPALMPRALLSRTNYLTSFPQLLGSVHSFTGNAHEHAELVAAAAAGQDWGPMLAGTEVVLCPAACHLLYPLCEGDVGAHGRRFDIVGQCFRSEPSDDPARMQTFRQHEHVFLGSPDAARAHRDRWVLRAQHLLTGLGLHVVADAASDPFFGRLSAVLAAGQRRKELKFEILGTTSSRQVPTALASGNYHEDHFGSVFGIRTPDGAPAHTACVGFGLERVTLALLARHGMDPGAWPAEVRHVLGLSVPEPRTVPLDER